MEDDVSDVSVGEEFDEFGLPIIYNRYGQVVKRTDDEIELIEVKKRNEERRLEREREAREERSDSPPIVLEQEQIPVARGRGRKKDSPKTIERKVAKRLAKRIADYTAKGGEMNAEGKITKKAPSKTYDTKNRRRAAAGGAAQARAREDVRAPGVVNRPARAITPRPHLHPQRGVREPIVLGGIRE